MEKDRGWSVKTGVVLRCGPNSLVDLLDTGDREEEGEEEEENATSLALTISVKAVVNDDLTLIVLTPMSG